MIEAVKENQNSLNEDWRYKHADLIAHVKKSDEGWGASIGRIKPIGYGFTKYFSSREEAIKFLKQPVCRNGKTEATVGMAQKVWKGWK